MFLYDNRLVSFEVIYMARVIEDTVVTTFSFSVHDIESSKDSVLSMLRSFRVMNKVTDSMWNNLSIVLFVKITNPLEATSL